MRCKGCDYPLWDIAARACPECGLPFRPSEYEFAINSVRFCCPHCHQAYYGTGDRGHLIPPRFHCVSCARLIDIDEMLVLPRDGVPESVSLPDRMPWLERHRIGFWKALTGTWVRALGAPSRLAESIPKRAADGSGGPTIAPAFGYAMLFTIPYMILGLSFLLVPMAFGLVMGMGKTGSGMVIAAASVIAGVAVACLVLFFVWAILAHITLRLSGGTPAGFSGTVAALGYSSSVNFISAVPCIGVITIPIGMCWWAVVATLMAMRIQRATPLRAVCAYLVAPLVLLSLVGGGLIMLVYAVGPVPTPPPVVMPPAPPRAQATVAPRSLDALADRVAGACLSYRDREGTWPRTCLDLVRGNDITAAHLIYTGDPTTIRAGVITLDELDLLLADQLRLLADIAASERDHPSGIARTGQVILFTKDLVPAPGVDDEQNSQGEPDLSDVWIAVAVSSAKGATGKLIAINAHGSSYSIEATQQIIDAQNEIRRARNLPELPPLDEWP